MDSLSRLFSQRRGAVSSPYILMQVSEDLKSVYILLNGLFYKVKVLNLTAGKKKITIKIEEK